MMEMQAQLMLLIYFIYRDGVDILQMLLIRCLMRCACHAILSLRHVYYVPQIVLNFEDDDASFSFG